MSYIFVHRGVVFAQLILFALIAGLGFWIGYVFGTQQVPPGSTIANRHQAGASTLLVKGAVSYETGTGRLPDGGAVVIVLPRGVEKMGQKISGWKGPSEPGPPPDSFVEAVHEAGGDLAMVNESGAFEIVVPRPGEYDVLIISAHGRRPTGQLVQKQQLDEMVERFESPSTLIGWQQYDWHSTQIDKPPQAIEQTFSVNP